MKVNFWYQQIESNHKTDKIKNDASRESSSVIPVMSKIEDRQLSWFGHLARMRNDNLNNVI